MYNSQNMECSKEKFGGEPGCPVLEGTEEPIVILDNINSACGNLAICGACIKPTFENLTLNVAEADQRANMAEELAARESARADIAEINANTDSLTGLANRRKLESDFNKLAAGEERGVYDAIGAVFIDVEKFKKINDELGQAQGDKVLTLLGEAFSDNSRDIDTVARYGGDEFFILQPVILTGRAALLKPHLMENAKRRHVLARNRQTTELKVNRILNSAQAVEISQMLNGTQLRLHYKPVVKRPDETFHAMYARASYKFKNTKS